MCWFKLHFVKLRLRLDSAQFSVDQQSRGLKTSQEKLQRMSGCWLSCMELYALLHVFNSLSSEMKYTHGNTKYNFLLLLLDDNEAQEIQMKQRTLP